MAPRACVGTSGWNYPHWRRFYAGVPRRRWLQHAASRFTALEINASFYRLQDPRTFARWERETPPGFVFAMKGHRYLTHNKKLLDPLPAVRRDRDAARALGEKLRAVVWQLPARLGPHLPRLEAFLAALGAWPEVRHAVEFRHAGWFRPEVAALLEAHRVAVCQSDAADWPLWSCVTTDLVYVRLHGHEETYVSRYGRRGLLPWVRRARRWLDEGREVHVYFDNDARGAAPEDAREFMAMLGLKPPAPA